MEEIIQVRRVHLLLFRTSGGSYALSSMIKHGGRTRNELECFFHLGAGTFGTVRAGIYKPKNGGPQVECAIKALKPMDELPTQKVWEQHKGGLEPKILCP